MAIPEPALAAVLDRRGAVVCSSLQRLERIRLPRVLLLR
jgi:hypothetical protein